MNPIPYEEITGSDPTSIILKIVIGLLIMTAGALFIAASKRKKEGKASKHGKKGPMLDDLIGLAAVTMGAVLIGAGLGPLVRAAPAYSQIYRQTEAVQKELKSTYGVKLSHEEAEALKYPTEAPKAKFKVYGSFDEQKQTEGKSFESRTVYLVWSDGSLGLSESTDGESFTPLKPKA